MGLGEDAAKKDEVRGFLERVSNGLGYIDEIWIDRKIKPSGSGEPYCTARSLLGRQINTITELLKDDIDHAFKHGLFTFRFVAAVPGSGKTAILNYLKELIETQPVYTKNSIVVNFAFNELLAESGQENFGVKFYSYLLTQTFWQLMKQDSELSVIIKSSAEEFLVRMTRSKEKVAHIKANNDEEIIFTNELNVFLTEIKTNFRKLFFALVNYISKAEPQVNFVYLIDELDAVSSHHMYLHDTRSVIRDLINEAISIQKLRLMIYIVGRPEDVQKVIEDTALHSRVADSVINLIPCRLEECEGIRGKIEERISGAYSGCKDFKRAWEEIKAISLEVPHDFNTLREFCKKYAQKVIEIHEKYFKYFDKSFNLYETLARQKIESEVLREWSDFLGIAPTEEKAFEEKRSGYLGHTKWKKYRGKPGYALLLAQTTTHYKEHNLDCYGELRHNNDTVAHVYGEAKNYSLIQEHIDTFSEWLKDFDYKYSEKSPHDLAFVVATSFSFLQEQKLEKKHIRFTCIAKVIDEVEPSDGAVPVIVSPVVPSAVKNGRVDINTTDKETLNNFFQNTGIRKPTLDKIYDNRTYTNIEDLFRKLKPAKSTKEKIQAKFDAGEIYFS